MPPWSAPRQSAGKAQGVRSLSDPSLHCSTIAFAFVVVFQTLDDRVHRLLEEPATRVPLEVLPLVTLSTWGGNASTDAAALYGFEFFADDRLDTCHDSHESIVQRLGGWCPKELGKVQLELWHQWAAVVLDVILLDRDRSRIPQ
jgi:hypothetical protein